MAARLDVIGIAVRDMGESLRFYRLLGLEPPEGSEGEPHVEADAGGFHVDWDTVQVLEQVYGEVYGEWTEPVGHRIELAFRCDSRDEVDATYQRVLEAGYEGFREPWDAFWGQRYAVVRDPDGNLVSLYAN